MQARKVRSQYILRMLIETAATTPTVKMSAVITVCRLKAMEGPGSYFREPGGYIVDMRDRNESSKKTVGKKYVTDRGISKLSVHNDKKKCCASIVNVI
jgi:hypothetical protein